MSLQRKTPTLAAQGRQFGTAHRGVGDDRRGVAAYADSHADDAFLERRGGKTFLVTVE